ncbi:MAG: aldehyde dehydrogenase family protein [Evtepia sp.]|nr:aldehyde dehydrogenase family protein [Evtepia sp.]
MNQDDILKTLESQRQFFREGHTRGVASRLDVLRRLRDGILDMEKEILAALHEDLGKSAAEAYLSEIGVALGELRFMMRHVKSFAKPRRARASLAQLPGRCRILPEPYGTALIISPWNYPFLLAIQPAIDAIAAGNTVVIKPSEHAPATSRVLTQLFSHRLLPEWAVVIQGDHRESQMLLECPFDYIFYTGGPKIGRIVMEKAAAQLTPVTLELGGKSPCVVDETANLALAARRIVFGKYLNCGQTCVAPDYLYVQEDICEPLMAAIGDEILAQYGQSPLHNPDYGKIINQDHFDRLMGLIDRLKVSIGGDCNPNTLQIAPTVLKEISFSDPIMEDEIFGPILPVLTYRHLEEAIGEISARPHPLALYLFSENKSVQQKLMNDLQFGGGCINDTILHLASSHMGFGGIGGSGMGSYHGKAGFDAFTHEKAILQKNAFFDPAMRYPPYTDAKARLLRRLMR